MLERSSLNVNVKSGLEMGKLFFGEVPVQLKTYRKTVCFTKAELKT